MQFCKIRESVPRACISYCGVEATERDILENVNLFLPSQGPGHSRPIFVQAQTAKETPSTECH